MYELNIIIEYIHILSENIKLLQCRPTISFETHYNL